MFHNTIAPSIALFSSTNATERNKSSKGGRRKEDEFDARGDTNDHAREKMARTGDAYGRRGIVIFNSGSFTSHN
jgi:hypothetical protein